MVTGAGTGFGGALAVRAAQEGAARVLVHYRSSSAGAERTADRVTEAGAVSAVAQGDITPWADIKRMVAWAFDEHGGGDVLVNNVGDMASGQASWEEVTEQAIDHVLAVDIKGTMLMVHEFGQRMVARGGGAIVNVGSTVIVRGSPRGPHYAAGKYGLLGITKSYAKALAPSVRVNTFAPGSWRPRRCWPGQSGRRAGGRRC
jgi:3-oxoacyl-[acyl-carrier protein] reductase